MHEESDQSIEIISSTSRDNIGEGQGGPQKEELSRKLRRASSSWISEKKIIEKWGHPETESIVYMSWCLIGLIVDPLFLYIPTIDDKKQCLGIDKNLRIPALITLRSVSDLPFFAVAVIGTCRNIGSGFKSEFKPDPVAFAKALVAAMRLLNAVHVAVFLATLPIPQVAAVVFFIRMRSSGDFYKSAFLNAFLFLQYLPRLIIMHAVSTQDLILTRKWVKASLNLLLYICAGHVLGAFWYLFSIQRRTKCWHQACRNTTGCTTIYYCNDTSNSTNIKILNELCPINPENATIFDFGIFLDAFQSSTTGQRNFSSKLFYCLWWGIKNLSNFGTNLETSNYTWENCFAILISIIGLLLFLYFIGNVQTYIQMEVTKGEEIRELQSKMSKKNPVIESWMERHHLPVHIRKEIYMKQNSVESMKENIDVDVDLKGQLSILSKNGKDLTVEHLCKDILKKVRKFRELDTQALKKICEHLKPVIYTENSFVVREGEPLGLMLFIIDGTIWTYKTKGDDAGKTETGSSSMMKIGWLEKGDFYGEQLLSCCASPNCSLSHLPISAEDVQCQTKIEAFALMAKDLGSWITWWNKTNYINSCNPIDQIDENSEEKL